MTERKMLMDLETAVAGLVELAANVKPSPIMGDDDSIYLSDRQEGYRDGLLAAVDYLRQLTAAMSDATTQQHFETLKLVVDAGEALRRIEAMTALLTNLVDLRAALKPFAKEASQYEGIPDCRLMFDDAGDAHGFRVSDLRRAKAALDALSLDQVNALAPNALLRDLPMKPATEDTYRHVSTSTVNADLLSALRRARATFAVEYSTDDRVLSVSHDSDALRRLVHDLDSVIAKAEASS